MDWDALLNALDEAAFTLEENDPEPDLGRLRTPAYHAARRQRVAYLKAQLAAGAYGHRPAHLIADGILHGRPKWGEALIDPSGRRLDETDPMRTRGAIDTGLIAVPGLPEALAGIPGHDAGLRRAIQAIEINNDADAWEHYLNPTPNKRLRDTETAYGRQALHKPKPKPATLFPEELNT